ncbi:fructose- -bisphosphatase 2 [Nannochloropsis gaditana]|uniref:D-fructose-1,6-bisphosphate 1-phosphohydrolase n=1 Tax=Nannochloropsis gaditana TaxID=72520 RepID=W7TD05_9STRA|nr:fructose- -bisphosphatase 2 [Nannochloropsis gaditana]
MGFIMEQAGGRATTGSEAIHDLQPKSVHQRVPTFLGSPEDVDELVASLKKLQRFDGSCSGAWRCGNTLRVRA